MMGYIYYEYATYQPIAIANMPMQFPITIAKSDKGYKTVGNYAVKQEMLQKMKTAVPFSIEANKTVRPNIYSRR